MPSARAVSGDMPFGNSCSWSLQLHGVLEETARVFEEKPRHIQPTLFTSVENGTESS